VRTINFVAAAVTLTIMACGAAAPSPKQVTQKFWEALRGGDAVAAATLASTRTAHRVEDLAGRDIDAVLLGEALEGDTAAIVRTSLATAPMSEPDGRPIQTTFDTHLVREEGRWRVDVTATARNLDTALFAGSIAMLGEAVGQGVQEFSEALEQGAAEISRAIREALEDLERDLE